MDTSGLEEDEFKCTYWGRGCQGSFVSKEDLDSHINSCPFTLMECPQECDQWVTRKSIAIHMGDECPNRRVHCNFCPVDVPFVKIEDHQRRCKYRPSECGYCDHVALLKDMEKHHGEECEFKPNPCKLKLLGCDFVGPLASRLQHEQDFCFHIPLMYGSLSKEIANNGAMVQKKMEEFAEKIRQELNEPKKICNSLDAQTEEIEKQIDHLANENNNLKENLPTDQPTTSGINIKGLTDGELKNELETIKRVQMKTLENSVSKTNLEMMMATLVKEIESIKEKQTMTSAKLMEETQNLKTEMKYMITMQTQFFRAISQNIKNLSLEHARDLKNMRKAFKKLRVALNENDNYSTDCTSECDLP